jgi:hypothetical protein
MKKSKSPDERKRSIRSDSKPQDFKSVARRLGCDEDRARFEEKLGKIARAKPKPS